MKLFYVNSNCSSDFDTVFFLSFRLFFFTKDYKFIPSFHRYSLSMYFVLHCFLTLEKKQ